MQFLGGLLAIFVLVMLVGPVAASNSGQCPQFNEPVNLKVDTNDGTVVLAKDVVFCVHASNNNTGVLTADGVHDLDWFISQYIVNNGGQVPTISNYVVYGGQKPSQSPESSSTPSTSPSASTTPSSSPSAEPSVSPSPTPTPSSKPGPSSSPTSSPRPRGLPRLTPPPTDTE